MAELTVGPFCGLHRTENSPVSHWKTGIIFCLAHYNVITRSLTMETVPRSFYRSGVLYRELQSLLGESSERLAAKTF